MRIFEDRDDEHIALLKTVWFSEFEEMFYSDISTADAIMQTEGVIDFDIENGMTNYKYELGIHPKITKQHLGHLSKQIRGHFVSGRRNKAVKLLLMTNIAIELILMGVLPSLARLFFLAKYTGIEPSDYNDVLFASYKKEEEQDGERTD